MQIVLLSGGSGKRLWPLSNDVRSKQFLKVLSDEDGNRQSMAQRVYSQITKAHPTAELTIATNAAQADSIRAQMGDAVNIVLEPERRDTFPAIVLSCAFLALEKKVDLEETVAVLPVDPFTEQNFFYLLSSMDKLVSNSESDIALIGIKPTLATSKYGYIVPDKWLSVNAYSVSRFVEKPDEETAAILIENGAYWNGGVFAFKLKYLMDIAEKCISFRDFDDLLNKYNELERISFDYKVVENAKSVAVVPYHGKWSDIGTWRTLVDEMPINKTGFAVAERTRNTYIINELGIPIVALGTKDLVVAASPDGILVSDLVESSQLKPIVDSLVNTRPMFEERRWGEYTVVAKDEYSLVKQLFLTEGKEISYQSHKYRDEYWVITSGDGEFILDGKKQSVTVGDMLSIKREQKHKIRALTDLHITEVQIGEVLSEDDIEKFPNDKEEGT